VTTDRIVGAILVCAGLATGLEATTFDVAFMTDPVGPRALPLLVAGIFVAAGVVTFARPRPDLTLPERTVQLRMVAALSSLLLYAALLPWIGFFLSTTLVVTALALLYRGPPARAAGAAALLSAGLWFLFVRLLSLPLPVGELWIR